MVRRLANREVVLAVCRSLREGDNRVALPPEALSGLKASCWSNGREHTELRVIVEQGAGERSGYSDEEYQAAGARIVGLSDILDQADILVDVKQRPAEDILREGVNIFYAHVEKGQAVPYLAELLNLNSATLYSPETIFLPTIQGPPRRGVNLGFYAGVGAVHLAFEGVRISNARRGLPDGPLANFPVVLTSTLDDITDAYGRFKPADRELKVAIIGSESGLVASGAIYEFNRAHYNPVMIDRTITGSQDRLEAELSRFDIIINASLWNPGEPRIITRRQLAAMREGAVLIDATCDVDGSSVGETEGDPVVGGVRFCFESKWTDSHLFYWVGPDQHTAKAKDPTLRSSNDLRVLYNANGMIPGGTSTARPASKAYSGMLFPYLVNIIRAVSMGIEVPSPGLVLRRGVIAHEGLRQLVAGEDRFTELRKYL